MKNRLSIIIITAVVAAAAGYAAAYFPAQRDMQAMSFARAIGNIATSHATLTVIDQGRVDKAVRLHKSLMRAAAMDAVREREHAKRITARSPNLRRALDRAAAYGARNGMPEVVRDIAAIRSSVSP